MTIKLHLPGSVSLWQELRFTNSKNDASEAAAEVGAGSASVFTVSKVAGHLAESYGGTTTQPWDMVQGYVDHGYVVSVE